MFDPEATIDLDALRARLRAMNDQMLRRWEEAAARLCRPEANLGAHGGRCWWYSFGKSGRNGGGGMRRFHPLRSSAHLSPSVPVSPRFLVMEVIQFSTGM